MPKKKSQRQSLEATARKIARSQGIPESLFLALITQESGWNPTAGSGAGARGLTQLMPATARGLGVRDVFNPVQNLTGGAKYLRGQLEKFGSPELALSAYNSGPGGAESSGRIEGFEETQNYVRRVMELEKQYSGGQPLPTGALSALTANAAASPNAVSPAGAPSVEPQGPAFGAPPAPGLPSLSELLSRVGPISAQVAEGIEGEEAAQASQAAPAATDVTAAPTDGGVPTVAGGTPAVGGLNADFAARFAKLQAAVKSAGGDLTIYSGGRSAEKQAGLYQNALKKYGSESEARKWVAPPGKSNHDTHAAQKYGLGDGAVASDLRGDLAMAHQLAPKFGLVFPLSNEAWHIELAGIRGK
jgi:Transglycosylase SLT domain/D-alanyl-D-alanine carboxypeptidase